MMAETLLAAKKSFLSPLAQRRLNLFLAGKKVRVALTFWCAMLLLSLGAGVLATDKPWLIRYDGHYFFPLWNDYPETAFGGLLPTTTDYSDPVVAQLITANGTWWRAPVPWRWDTFDTGLQESVPAPPSWRHWLGTDDSGRDVLARVLYGVRVSLLFAMAVSLGSLVLGIAIGGLQGYFAGRVDLYGQRLIEIWSGMPSLMLLMLLSSIVTPNLIWLLLATLLFSWTGLADIVRAEFLRTRRLDYVTAAILMGLPLRAIMVRHILPNAMIATLTYLPFTFTGAISILTSLDFLGLGLPPGSPSLGELVSQASNNPQAGWLGITAFITLTLMLSLTVFIGEGIRDAFDPRLELSR